MWQDIKFAVRMLAKAPGFTAVAVLTLALGIGANTAIFSAVNGLILKPLPYADSSRLVSISGVKLFPNNIMGTLNFSPDIWQKVRAQTPAIEQMALYSHGEFTITGEAAPEVISDAYVSSDFFPMMGVRPLAGRPILPEDAQPGATAVVVVSYALWQARWGGDPSAIGRTAMLNEKPYTIIGVMPPDFDFGFYDDAKGVWVPLIVTPSQKGVDGPQRGTVAVARLKQGVSLAAANAQLKTVSARFATDFAEFGKGGDFQASTLEHKFGDLDNALLILLGAVGFVLLIACVNVSGLLLVRGWARQKEVAIREALGASRVRIVRQFLTESVLLALAGGALGMLFSIWGVHVLRAITPTDAPEHGRFLLNANVLWFTLAVSLLTGIVFGLAPAMQSSARRVGATLKDGLGGSLAGFSAKRPRKLRSALVIVEVALAVVLVVGATLVARSFDKLMSVNLGLRTDHILTMTANFGKSVCGTDHLASCQLAVADVVQRMRAIPGVQSAAITSTVPLSRWSLVFQLRIAAQTGSQAQEISLNSGATIADRIVSPEYFRTMGIPLLSGRGFHDSDTESSGHVAIVDKAFAHKYLGDHPLGRRISDKNDKNSQPQWMEIVGEVSEARDVRPDAKPEGEIYIPFGQATYLGRTNFIARTAANPMMMAPALQRAIWSVDKYTPITDLETMDQVVADSMAQPRFQAILLGSFGALGLMLAMGGIYGVISYGVTQRTREIGMRMALGAQRGDVLRMMLREGMLLVSAGVAIGIGGALALGRFLQSLLFEIRPTDPATFVIVAMVLLIVALAACYVPARRAMRIEPMEALRYE